MLSDPIAALSTPPGRSAIAVVRLSGTGALDVAGRVVAAALDSAPERTAILVTFLAPDGAPIDRGLVTIYRSPHSYTGEDLVEFSCHGGLLAPAEVLAALHAAGARQAEPGEFTRRAVLNGKLDLLQAEAVGDLIDATAPAQRRAALHQLDGGLSRRLGALREDLLELLAVLAYDIDFPEEDDGPVAPERLLSRLEAVRGTVAGLLATASAGERLREGALVVIAGPPNAGKSSLFNALLGANRALVTEIPGTTRDTIEAPCSVLGWPVRLADTAGLREADDRIEQLGIEVSRRYVAAADLVLLCLEAGRSVTPEERALVAQYAALLVRTKADLAPAWTPEVDAGFPVSALTGQGLDRLVQGIAARVFGGAGQGHDLTPMLTRERHRVALGRAGEALAEAQPHLRRGGEAVLVAHHVHLAVAALDELIGVVHPDEVLGRVFERFCVGK
jgi:tRNA modification GTPase